MPTEPESPRFGRWMPSEVARASYALEDQLLAVWKDYVRTIGPRVVSAYRANRLKDQPSNHVLDRVQEKMRKIAWDLLWDEEMKQDEEERTGPSSSGSEG